MQDGLDLPPLQRSPAAPGAPASLSFGPNSVLCLSLRLAPSHHPCPIPLLKQLEGES